MKTQTLKIDGMSCGHCVMTLKKELSKIEGVTVTTAGIGSAEIALDESKVTGLRLEEAVKEAGFSLVSIQ
jgi:copper chaperone